MTATAKISTYFVPFVLGFAIVVSGCDETDSDTADLLDGEAVPLALSTLLREGEPPVTTGPRSDDAAVEYWVRTVDKELAYARRLEAHWTEVVREAVEVASAARQRVDGATGLAREAAAAEARDVLDHVPWNEWSAILIACVDARISEADVAEARDSRTNRDPAWVAKVRRADRLKHGAGESLRELDARRSLQRAFYACELASQIAGDPLGVN